MRLAGAQPQHTLLQAGAASTLRYGEGRVAHLPCSHNGTMAASVVDIIRVIVLVGLGVVFVGMGVNHFLPKPARLMAKMIPPRLRFAGPLRPIVLVYLTGACEVLGGIALAVPLTRAAAAVALVLFLVAVFPANIYASQHPETFRSLSIPFWPRLAAQLVLIALTVWVGVL